MKKLIYLFAIVFFAVQCDRSSEIEETVEETPVLPVKIINDDDSETIKYDGSKISEMLNSDGSKTIFEYNENLISKITQYDEDDNLVSTASFSYTNDKLTSANYTEGIYRETFVYDYLDINTINCLKTATYFTEVDKELKTYNVIRGNIYNEEIEYYHNDELEGKINVIYTYDSKINVFKDVLGFDKIHAYIFSEWAEYAAGTNNLLTKYHVNTTVGGDVYKNRTVNSITYSDRDYPAKIISGLYSGSNQLISTETHTFQYNP